jgi:hypothetical protein
MIAGPMTAPTPETLDWLRQCAAAPGARWHRALLADVEGQTPPEIEPIPAEGLAWLQQSARVHGATYSQVLLHVLERIELLDKDSIEQFQSNRFCFEAIVRRLERLEATQQHDTLLIGGPQDKPTPPAAPATPAEGLVERVAKAIHPSICADPYLYQHEARAAIREVAAWIRSDLNGRSVADRLEQEADRG